jgi:hypothetical protein
MQSAMKTIHERIDAKRDLVAIEGEAEVIASQAPHLVFCFAGSTQNPTIAKNICKTGPTTEMSTRDAVHSGLSATWSRDP